MSSSLLFHEKESEDLAKRLSNLKQTMIDNDAGNGMSKKFGCVRIGRIKDTACTVSKRNSSRGGQVISAFLD
jgi:hypothetical protein